MRTCSQMHELWDNQSRTVFIFKEIEIWCRKHRIEIVEINQNLSNFLEKHSCLSTSSRLNTMIKFQLVDVLKSLLIKSSFSFVFFFWATLLKEYSSSFRIHIIMILCFETQLRYEDSNEFILFKNLVFANNNSTIIDNKLSNNLTKKQVIEVSFFSSFISSSLSLISKFDDEWRHIHHLCHSKVRSVNDNISSIAAELNYKKFQNIIQLILNVERETIHLKRDIKNAFRNISIAFHNQWLLSFSWKNKYYKEICLLFELSTASFIFNLFVEDLDWILIFFLQWKLRHYLEDFIAGFSPQQIVESDGFWNRNRHLFEHDQTARE
jgi:hypothetical protein